MTTVLFENARLVDPEAEEVTKGWLLVKTGKIKSVGSGDAPDADTRVDCRGKCLAPGIVDLGVKVCEPGERHKESYRSAGAAAAAGGVTTMITRPDTLPAIDIVAKLDTLGDEERAAIGRYESTHRQRRTVLGKLAQLAEQ